MEYASGGIIKAHAAAPDSVPVRLDDGYYLCSRVVKLLGADLLKRLNDATPKES